MSKIWTAKSVLKIQHRVTEHPSGTLGWLRRSEKILGFSKNDNIGLEKNNWASSKIPGFSKKTKMPGLGKNTGLEQKYENAGLRQKYKQYWALAKIQDLEQKYGALAKIPGFSKKYRALAKIRKCRA